MSQRNGSSWEKASEQITRNRRRREKVALMFWLEYQGDYVVRELEIDRNKRARTNICALHAIRHRMDCCVRETWSGRGSCRLSVHVLHLGLCLCFCSCMLRVWAHSFVRYTLNIVLQKFVIICAKNASSIINYSFVRSNDCAGAAGRQWLWKLLQGELMPRILFGYTSSYFRWSHTEGCRSRGIDINPHLQIQAELLQQHLNLHACIVQKMREQNKALSIMSSTSKATAAAPNSPQRKKASVEKVRSCHIEWQRSICLHSPPYPWPGVARRGFRQHEENARATQRSGC